MKNQYFADRRDLFKFDLLLDIAEHQRKRLVLIPMLTPNDESGEGNVTNYDCGARRRVLFDSLRGALASNKRDIRLMAGGFPTQVLDLGSPPFENQVVFLVVSLR